MFQAGTYAVIGHYKHDDDGYYDYGVSIDDWWPSTGMITANINMIVLPVQITLSWIAGPRPDDSEDDVANTRAKEAQVPKDMSGSEQPLYSTTQPLHSPGPMAASGKKSVKSTIKEGPDGNTTIEEITFLDGSKAITKTFEPYE